MQIDKVKVTAYTIPTDKPESDGTIEWDSTTMVMVQIYAGDFHGTGYSYAHAAAAYLADTKLKQYVIGQDPLNNNLIWENLNKAVRNLGRPGIASAAISAIDVALWDLKARMLDLPLLGLLGQVMDKVPLYGSGGFTSYSIYELQDQFRDWIEAGFRQVKMKVGRVPEDDQARVKAAREVIGDNALFVDANGAYTARQAISQASRFSEFNVSWFEEPVSSDDLGGMKLVRQHAPPGMDITSGEYGYDQYYFRNMITAGAVDVLMADATRCGGITGFLKASQLAEAFNLPVSSHTAPSIHLQAAASLPNFKTLEYFYDHVRIEKMLLDGYIEPEDGFLIPDLSGPGLGWIFKEQDAEKFKVY